MKIQTIAAVSLVLALTACGGKKKNETEKVSLKTSKDSASYAAGLNEGERMLGMMKQSKADSILDMKLFLQGFNDYMNEKPQLQRDMTQKVLATFFGKLQQETMEKKFGSVRETNLKFLADNKAKPGVVTTPSGLQYTVVKKGNGPTIKIGDIVEVHYTLKLTDGTELETSRGKEPMKLELQPTGLIQAWIEGLQLMNKGAQYTLFVPWELGYGERGDGQVIPPYSVLIFDIEVVNHEVK